MVAETSSEGTRTVTALDARTQDIDQRLTRFSGLLDDSMESASARARDVARLVSETSAEGTRAVTEQYEQMREAVAEQSTRARENAEEERNRTIEAMRNAYEQASGETHVMFREASDRFAEVMRGMKQMAAEMQRELEQTRNDLRRGIFDLPQETAESAAQMRRVIVDQIEALAELNRIVARHGRNLDAVEPMRRAAGRDEPSLSIVGGRSEPAARSETARYDAPRPETRHEPARHEPARHEPARPAATREEPASFAPAPRRTATSAPSFTPPQDASNRGWLSDLLTRASREDEEPAREFPRETAREPARSTEERTARHSIESLDSLSVDIARMIDHEAATDLWDRYKRGERNVFTRRLYTLQGQKAFDEIRRKYRGDREFKQTVDRYIGEFERLLDEVARDDRGQVVARTYLTSETGKVYTMLAHAAGRFD